MSSAEHAAMRRALALAAQPHLPRGPNPRVGCVLLSPEGDIVGEGWHAGAGTPHAEVMAVQAAGPRAEGATAVVTLEPCDHTGRTGPCSRVLLEAGVARVVIAQADTSGTARGGAQRLADAGIEVEQGLLGEEAAALNPEWTFSLGAGRPFVTWKLASSLDGRVAAGDGSSRWITSPQARAQVHRGRARCDAVLVGTGTVHADDPHLTVRDEHDRPAGRQPLRAVVGLSDLPTQARVLDDAAATVHLRTRDPIEALRVLHDRGCHHVWLEGGPTVAGAFVAADVVDRVVAYLAPVLLGDGPPALGHAGVPTLAAAPRLTVVDVTQVGPDVRVVAERKET